MAGKKDAFDALNRSELDEFFGPAREPDDIDRWFAAACKQVNNPGRYDLPAMHRDITHRLQLQCAKHGIEGHSLLSQFDRACLANRYPQGGPWTKLTPNKFKELFRNCRDVIRLLRAVERGDLEFYEKATAPTKSPAAPTATATGELSNPMTSRQIAEALKWPQEYSGERRTYRKMTDNLQKQGALTKDPTSKKQWILDPDKLTDNQRAKYDAWLKRSTK